MTAQSLSFEERLARNMGVQDALNDLVDFLEKELRKVDVDPGAPVRRQVVLGDVVRWAQAQRAMIRTEDERLHTEFGGPRARPQPG
jgi:hypothetical protein